MEADIGPVLPIVGLLGTVVSAVGAIAGAEAQQQNANYQAQVAANNAKIQAYNQRNAIEAGRQDAQKSSLQNAARMAGIRAEIAASGVDVNTGSAEKVQRSQREVGELGTQNVYHNAEIKAYGYQIAGYNDTAQSQLYKNEASQAGVAGLLGAAGSILGGAKAFAGIGGGTGGGTGVLSPDISGADTGLMDEMLA